MNIEQLRKIKHVYEKILTHPTFTGLKIDNDESQVCQQPTFLKSFTTTNTSKPTMLKKLENQKIKKKQIEYISPVRKKELNSYQLFVKQKSEKTKYKMLSPKSRMKAIAKKWNDKK
jgi:hypothetical protein